MQGGISIRTEGGIQVIYGPDGAVLSRHYLLDGSQVHEVNPLSGAKLRGVAPTAYDPFAPKSYTGSYAAEVSKSDPTQVIVAPYGDAKPISLTRATGAPDVPFPKGRPNPVVGAAKLMYTLAHGIKFGQPTLLEGPPGVAKTYGAQWLASLLGYNGFVLQVSASIDEDEFIGRYAPVELPNGSVVPKYVYTIVHAAVNASRLHPTMLIFDELNRIKAQGAIASIFSLLAEGWIGGKFLDSGKREKVEAGEGNLHIVATQNPSQRNMPDATYRTYDLDDALLDRLSNKAILDWPSVEEQRDILVALVPNGDKDDALQIAKLAERIRRATNDGLPQPIATRTLTAYMRDLAGGQSKRFAFESKIMDSMTSDARVAVLGMAINEGIVDADR